MLGLRMNAVSELLERVDNCVDCLRSWSGERRLVKEKDAMCLCVVSAEVLWLSKILRCS